MIEFEQSDISWLEGLPATPRRVLTELLTGGTSAEDAIELWLGSSRQMSIASMGGTSPTGTYSAIFLRELRLLICTNDPKYKVVRDQMPRINKGTVMGATGLVSTALTPHVGLASALIGPAVVLMFFAVAQVGVMTWCAHAAADSDHE